MQELNCYNHTNPLDISSAFIFQLTTNKTRIRLKRSKSLNPQVPKPKSQRGLFCLIEITFDFARYSRHVFYLFFESSFIIFFSLKWSPVDEISPERSNSIFRTCIYRYMYTKRHIFTSKASIWAPDLISRHQAPNIRIKRFNMMPTTTL